MILQHTMFFLSTAIIFHVLSDSFDNFFWLNWSTLSSHPKHAVHQLGPSVVPGQMMCCSKWFTCRYWSITHSRSEPWTPREWRWSPACGVCHKAFSYCHRSICSMIWSDWWFLPLTQQWPDCLQVESSGYMGRACSCTTWHNQMKHNTLI